MLCRTVITVRLKRPDVLSKRQSTNYTSHCFGIFYISQTLLPAISKVPGQLTISRMMMTLNVQCARGWLKRQPKAGIGALINR